MGRFLRILFLLFSICSVGWTTLSAQNNLSVNYSGIASVPDFLNVCGDPDTVMVTVSVNGGQANPREDILATVGLFTGIQLVNFLPNASSTGVSLQSATDPTNPQFSLPDLEPNGTTAVNIAFSIRAQCDVVDTLALNEQLQVFDTWNFEYTLNGNNLSETDQTAEYRDALAVPFFTIDVINDNPPARVGSCYTREIVVSNSSLEGTVNQLRYENLQADGVFLSELKINGTVTPFGKIPNGLGDTLVAVTIFGNTFQDNQDSNGNTLFDPNETMIIEETYCLMACDAFTGSLHSIQWGCNEEFCASFETIDFVELGTGSANVGFIDGGSLDNEFAGYCATGQSTISYVNNGLEFNPGFATMIDVEAGINFNGDNVLETDGYRITGIRIAGIDLVDFDSMNLLHGNPLFTTDPDGLGGLTDFDGDGYFDDLPIEASIEITAFYEFDCSNADMVDLEDEDACTNDFSVAFNGCIQYSDACDNRQERFNFGYFRPTNSNDGFDNNSDTDAFVETDVFFLHHQQRRSIRFFERNCGPDEQFLIKVILPEHIDFVANQSGMLINEITTVPFNSFTMDGDTLLLEFDASAVTFLSGLYDLTLAFQATCEAAAGPTEFPIIFEHNCPACDCNHVWYCGIIEGPVLHKTNPPCMPDQLPPCEEGLRTTAFSADRITFGYTDATYTQPISPDEVNTKVAISCDQLSIKVDNVVGETPVSDNLGVAITHFNVNGSNSPIPLFEFLGGTVRFVQNGVPVECPIPADNFQIEADTSFKAYRIDLSDCLLNLGLTLQSEDSVNFEGIFSINPDGPFGTQFQEIPVFRGYGYSLVNGAETSCDNFGENFTIAKNQVAFAFPNGGDFPIGCENKSLEYRLVGINNSFGDFFPDEFRAGARVDSIILEFDPALLTAYDDLSVEVSIPGHPVHGDDFFDLPPLTDFPDGNYIATFDTLLQVPALNFVLPYMFNMRVNLTPTCSSGFGSNNNDFLYNFDVKVAYTDRFYATEIGDGDCSESVEDFFEAVITYEEPPFFTLTPTSSADFVLLGDTATWIVQHCNTSFTSDADLTWLAIEDPTGTIDVISMELLDDPNNPTPLTIQDYGVNQENTFAYTDPLLRANGINSLDEICNFIRIKALVNNCENVDFTARAGWNCEPYDEPDWTPNLYEPCEDYLLSLGLGFENPFLEASVVDQPTQNLNICDVSTITLLLKNIDRGTLFDLRTQFILPEEGATLIPGSVEIAYPSSNAFVPAITDPTLIGVTGQGQVFQYDDFFGLDNYLNDNGLKGFNVDSPSDSNEVRIRFSYQTDCNFTSGSLSFYNFQGRKGCGDLSNFEAGESFPLIISGAEPDLSKLFQVEFAGNSFLVPNSLSTVGISFTNLTNTPTNENDFVRLVLPPGFTYASGSTSAVQPVSWNIAEPEITFQNGQQVLTWQMAEGLLLNQSGQLQIQLNTPDIDCQAGVQEVLLLTISETEVFCSQTNEDCDIETITSSSGTNLSTIPVSSEIGITFFNVLSECIENGIENLTVEAIIFSLGDDYINETFTISLFNDLNQNGFIDNEPLIFSNTVTGDATTTIPLNFNLNTDVPSADICNLLLQVQSETDTVCGRLLAILPDPRFENAGDIQIICAEGSQTITTQVGIEDCADQNALDITWSAIPPAMDTDIDNNKLAQPTITIDYDGVGNDTFQYVIATSRMNCTTVSLDTVAIVMAESLQIADQTLEIEPNESVQLSPNVIAGGAVVDFEWNPTTDLDDPQNFDPTASPEETITYFLIAENEFGCIDTAAFEVSVNILVVAEVIPSEAILCDGETLTLVASGGDTFEWIENINNPTFGNLNFANGDDQPFFENGIPGNVYQYDVVVSNSAFPDIQDTVSATISVVSNPEISISNDTTICLGEGAFLTATPIGSSGNLIYQWSPTPVFGQNTATAFVQPSVNTVYTLNVEDVNGCVTMATVNVMVENCGCSDIVVNGIQIVDATCDGIPGSAEILLDQSPTNYNFTWLPDLGVSNSDGNARSNLPVGGYSITITDVNNPTCFETTSLAIGTADGPLPDVLTTPAACEADNGTAQLSPTDWTYQWEDGTVAASKTNLSPGNYFVTVSDGNCENVITVAVGEENPLSATLEILTIPDCGQSNGSVAVNVTGGSGDYSFSWTGNTNTQSNLAAGVYQITITDNGPSGCVLPFVFLLNDLVQQVEVAITDTTDVTCFGGMNGSVEFIVNDPTGTLDTIISNGFASFENNLLPAGLYCIEMIDDNGCVSGGACFEIEQPDELIADITSKIACDNEPGSFVIEIMGGTPPYNYFWNGLPAGNDPSIANQSNIPPGAYDLVVVDANNCSLELTGLEIDICDDCSIFQQQDSIVLQVACEDLASVCLSIPDDNLPNYAFFDNGVPYTEDLEPCDFEFTAVYSLSTLYQQGNGGPYELIDWPGITLTGDVAFDNVQELVDLMNALDPDGDWQLNFPFISGGILGVDYGQMEVLATDINFSSFIGYNPQFTISAFALEVPVGSHELIAIDTVFGCVDTLFAEVVCTTPDTIDIVLPVGEDNTLVCMDDGELSADIDTIYNICPIGDFITLEMLPDTSCVLIIGENIGMETACLVFCDELDICDTTIVNVEVIQPCFTSSIVVGQVGDICFPIALLDLEGPVADFEITCPDPNPTIVSYTQSPDAFCLQYEGIGLGESSSCVALCDEFGNCDTVDICLSVLPGDLVTDTILVLEEIVTYCIDTTSLPGTIVTIEDICEDENGESVVFTIDSTNFCVTYEGIVPGVDTACIVLTDDLGNKNLTTFVITAFEIEATTFCDTFFINDPMIYYPDTTQLPGILVEGYNDCEDAGTENVDIYFNPIDFSIEYRGLSLGADTACLVFCDDLGYCDTVNLCLLVVDTLTMPIAVKDTSAITQTGTPIVIDVKSNDFLVGGIPSIRVITPPTMGTATVNLDCSVTYIPDVPFCDNTDIFEYEVCLNNNPLLCDTAMVCVPIECLQLTVFNAISPNNDGINDVFWVGKIESFTHHIEIYNRWGSKVFETDNYSNDNSTGWPATWATEDDLPDGTYYYIIEWIDDNGNEQLQRGYLEVFR